MALLASPSSKPVPRSIIGPPSLGSIVRPRKLTLLALSFDRAASRSEGLAGSADQVQLPTNSVKHTARKLQLIGDRMIDLLNWRQ